MIPVATTTIEVRSPVTPEGGAPVDPWGEGYDLDHVDETDEGGTSRKAAGVRAVISVSSGASSTFNGDEESVEFVLVCDPTPVTFRDLVRDETTGDVYEVRWAITTPGVAGLGHTRAGLRTVKGLAS